MQGDIKELQENTSKTYALDTDKNIFEIEIKKKAHSSHRAMHFLFDHQLEFSTYLSRSLYNAIANSIVSTRRQACQVSKIIFIFQNQNYQVFLSIILHIICFLPSFSWWNISPSWFWEPYQRLNNVNTQVHWHHFLALFLAIHVFSFTSQPISLK